MVSNSTCSSFPPSMSQFRTWFWVPVVAVLIPSTLLHILVRRIIGWRQSQKKCNSLFYRLFIIQGELELPLFYLYLLGELLVKDQPQGGNFLLLTNRVFFAKLYLYGTVYFYFHVQVWGVLVQSFNRLVGLYAPVSRVRYILEQTSNSQWRFINIAIPFAMLFRQILQDSTFFIVDTSGHVSIYSPPHVIEANQTQALIVAALGTGLSAICYVFVLKKMLTGEFNNNFVFGREVLFTRVGFYHFLALCALAGYHLMVKIAALTNIDLLLIVAHFEILPVMLVTFVNPWIFVFSDRRLRRRFFCY